MEILGIIGIVVALAFFIIAAMRGLSVLVSAPIAALIIIVSNGMDPITYLFIDPTNSFAAGMGSFVFQNAMLFILSCIIGKYIDVSGAAVTIARSIMKVTGKDNPFMVLVGVALVGFALTYGGVSLFVVMFALIPISKPLFKACDLPWHLFVAPFSVGCTGITMTLLPGAPSLTLIQACNFCGVPLTSTFVISIICSIVVIIVSLFYFKWAVKRSRTKGEKYDSKLPDAEVNYDKLPGLAASLAPLVALVGVIIVGSFAGIENIVYIAMTISIVLCALLFNKTKSVSHAKALGDGAFESLGPVIFTASGVGLGSIAAATPGFMAIADVVFNMPGGPLVSASTMAISLGAVSGEGLAAVSVMGNYFLAPYLATGVNAAVLAKTITIAACIGGALPNAGPIFGMFNAMGLSHKEAYKHIWWLNVVLMVGILVLYVALGTLFPNLP